MLTRPRLARSLSFSNSGEQRVWFGPFLLGDYIRGFFLDIAMQIDTSPTLGAFNVRIGAFARLYGGTDNGTVFVNAGRGLSGTLDTGNAVTLVVAPTATGNILGTANWFGSRGIYLPVSFVATREEPWLGLAFATADTCAFSGSVWYDLLPAGRS